MNEINNNSMNISFSVIVKKYLVAFFIAVLGLFAALYGAMSNQDTLFIIAGLNLLIGGVLAILFSAGILKQNLVIGIASVCAVITVYFGVSIYTAIEEAKIHLEDRARSEQLVRYNLGQIRDIQRAFKNENGRFAATWSELEEFFNSGKITVIDAEKPVPSKRLGREEIKVLYGDNRTADQNMTEREAALLAALGNPTKMPELVGFKRDTIRRPYSEQYLGSLTREKERMRLGLGAFKVENLRYIPMTNPKEEWTLETRQNVPYGGDTIPTIRVEGMEPVPFLRNGKKEKVGFGNLSTNSDKATWE
jgi:hypothetical protein